MTFVDLPWWLRPTQLMGAWRRSTPSDPDTVPTPVPKFADTLPVDDRARASLTPAHNPTVHE